MYGLCCPLPVKLQTPLGTVRDLVAADLHRLSKIALDIASLQACQVFDVVTHKLKCRPIKKVGWKMDFVDKNTPARPIPGWMGCTRLKKFECMGFGRKVD